MKHCNNCNRDLDESCFSKASSRRDGLQTQCKECQAVRRKRWDSENPDANRDSYYLRTYGITLDEYNEWFHTQGGRCAVCDTHQMDLAKKLAVDHDHITGEVRGLLCTDCNMAIGKLGDDIEGIERALAYLRDI